MFCFPLRLIAGITYLFACLFIISPLPYDVNLSFPLSLRCILSFPLSPQHPEQFLKHCMCSINICWINEWSSSIFSGLQTKDTVTFLAGDRFWHCGISQAWGRQPCSSHISTGRYSRSEEMKGERFRVSLKGEEKVLLPGASLFFLWPDLICISFAHWVVWVCVLFKLSQI